MFIGHSSRLNACRHCRAQQLINSCFRWRRPLLPRGGEPPGVEHAAGKLVAEQVRPGHPGSHGPVPAAGADPGPALEHEVSYTDSVGARSVIVHQWHHITCPSILRLQQRLEAWYLVALLDCVLLCMPNFSSIQTVLHIWSGSGWHILSSLIFDEYPQNNFGYDPGHEWCSNCLLMGVTHYYF